VNEEYAIDLAPGRPALTPQDVTAEWLTSCLAGQYPQVEVMACRAGDVMLGASTKIRVHLEYNDVGREAGLPGSMIVKGGFGRHGPEMDFIYWTEMRAYRFVLPGLDVGHPDCYFAGLDPRHRQPIVIMEDLAAAHAHFNNVLQPLPYEQAARFLDAMARYHARWWDDPALFDDNQLGFTASDSSDAFFAYVDHVLRPQTWAKYMRLPRAAVLPEAFKNRARLRHAMTTLREFHKISPFCIIHGDCHFGNSFVRADGGPGWVDWNIKKAPWYKDFAFFLVSAVDFLDRRRWEEALLSYYLGRLSHYGATPPDFPEAWLAYRREIVHGLLIWTTNGDDRGEFQLEPINTGNTAHFAVAASDHGTLDLFD
jgi:hypothetical protein